MTNASGKQTYDIFISYRTTHADWVETLAHNLKAQGYSLFLDRWELIPGQHFPGTIYQALKNSRCAILVASPDASDSGWVQQELELMLTQQNSGSGFFYVPIVMGEFPDLPFLETVQAVDFGDSSPELYRRAFQQLLCGLQQKPPDAVPMFKGELRLPTIDIGTRRPLVQREQTFLDAVFTQPETGRPLMILAQADINTQIYGRALRLQAEALYGADNVFHIFPPNSSRADSAAYFGRLAKQCHLEGNIAESWHWAEALSQKLESGRDIFLLVTGFENGPAESRRELAGELRQLNERYPALRVVMMGGEGLAALKYASGSLSLLNIAEELPIPQLTHLDLHNLFGHQYPQLNLSREQLQSVLDFTGCHPRLLPYCLQQERIRRKPVQRCCDNRLYPPNCSRVSMTGGIVCYSVPCWRKRHLGGLTSGQTMNYYAGYTGPI
jgi:hypothetical protein